MIDTLPTYRESINAVSVDKSTALHRFIHRYDPGGGKDEKLFCLMLLAVVIEAQRDALQCVEKQL